MDRTFTTIYVELLVLEAQSGNEQAFTRLVDLWTPKLRARARQLLDNTDAEIEIVQEAWIGIARSLRSLKSPSLFAPWSMRIVSHKSSDWIRKETRRRSNDRKLRSQTSELHSETTHPEDRPMIRRAIETLDSKLSEVVCLFYMDNCTIEQVAIVLDIPVGTAKTRLARARAILKSILEQSHDSSL